MGRSLNAGQSRNFAHQIEQIINFIAEPTVIQGPRAINLVGKEASRNINGRAIFNAKKYFYGAATTSGGTMTIRLLVASPDGTNCVSAHTYQISYFSDSFFRTVKRCCTAFNSDSRYAACSLRTFCVSGYAALASGENPHPLRA